MTIRQVLTALGALLVLTSAAGASDEIVENKALVLTLIKVDDGDSFAAYDASGQRYRIRLAGIDSPERAQPHGPAAGEHLKRLLAKKPITVFRRKKDRYKRWVARVVVNGADVALSQIQAGNAWHYKYYAREQPRDERAKFSEAEIVARQASVGLWQATNPVAPWEWRRNQRKKR